MAILILVYKAFQTIYVHHQQQLSFPPSPARFLLSYHINIEPVQNLLVSAYAYYTALTKSM